MSTRIIVFLFTACFLTQIHAQPSYVFARAPQLSPAKTSDLWGPFVKHLTDSTKTQITLKVYITREEFESDLRKGNIDFYFGNPGYGVIGHIRDGYVPIIRSNKKSLEGIVVVKKDSGIKNIDQLNNSTIAFPDKTAFAASLYLRASIKNNFNINYKSIYTGAHDNTYRAVLIGKAVAGGGVERTLQQTPLDIQDQLKIIYKTPGIRPHPIMAHPKVPLKIRQHVQAAVLGLNTSKAGKALLKKIKLQQPVIANYDLDYKNIENIITKEYSYLLD